MIKQLLLLSIFISISVFPQQDILNRYMLAQNYEQAGEFQKAKEIYEDLYQKQSNNFQFFDALNRVYLQLKEYDSSIKIIEERINTTQADVNMYGLLGKTYYLKGDEQKAFDTWNGALEKFPNEPASYRTIANYAIERRAFDHAVEYLNKGKKVSDDPRMFSFDLANIYSLTMRYRDAAREYCEVIAAHPNQYQLVESKILSYINKPDALEKSINVVKEYAGGDIVQFDYLHARLLMEKNELDEAFKIYLRIDKRQNNLGADLYNFANFAFTEKEFELAGKVFNEVIWRYPASPVISSAKLGYAKSMEEALNKKSEANDESWKPVYKINPAGTEEIENVVTAYSNIVNQYPHSEVAGESLLRIGRIYLYKKDDVRSAENYFNWLIKDYRNSHFVFDAYKELAIINLLQDNLNSAEENLLNIINNNRAGEDKKNTARYNLAKIKFYSGNFTSAKNYLGEVLNHLKDNIANDALDFSLLLNPNFNDSSNLLIFAKAEKLLSQKKYNEALTLYKEAAANKQGFMLQNRAKLKEAEVELALNNIEESISVLLEISSENEKNIYADRAFYLLGRIYQYGLKDNLKAAEMYESLLAKFPNSLYLDEARVEIIKIRKKINQGT